MSPGEDCAGPPDSPGRSVALAVDRLRRGVDVEGSARLVHDRFYVSLRTFFARNVSSAQDREDLTQETFLAAFRNIGTFRGESRFSTWLFQIALNTYHHWLRGQGRSARRRRSPPPPRHASPEPPLEPHDRLSPLGAALESERCRQLAAAIAELPAQQKRCIVAMFLQERTHREVAVMLGLSPATVKSHVYHARRSLVRALGGPVGEPPPPRSDRGNQAP